MKRIISSKNPADSVEIFSNKGVFLRRKSDFPSLSFFLSESEIKENKNKEISPLKIEKTLFRRLADIHHCTELNDSELIAVIKNKNREMYQELFNRYQRKLFVYILRFIGNRDEAEDVLQDVFTKTYNSIENFDESRKFSSWIYRIAHNEAMNFLKRKNIKYFVSFEDALLGKDKMDLSTTDEPLEDRMLHEENNKEIQEALKELPQRYREILQMRYFSEHSYEEIGKILGIPVNTVGTLISRAKRKLYEVVRRGK